MPLSKIVDRVDGLTYSAFEMLSHRHHRHHHHAHSAAAAMCT
jgi:hypothetical protein